jgi:hypothetical protein
MIGSFSNNLSLGFMYEEVVLCVLMEIFWGKFNALADAFHCSRVIRVEEGYLSLTEVWA